MKTKYLLSRRWRWVGWILFAIGLLLGFYLFTDAEEPAWLDVKVPDILHQDSFLSKSPSADEGVPWIKNNLADEIALSFILLGVLILMLAKQKFEDEMIMKLRLESLLWAAIANALLMLLTIWLIYDFAFFNVMIVNIVLFYLLFVIRFYWVLWQSKVRGSEE